MQRVAVLDPLGDAGIGGYTHELAQALIRAGIDIDVYSNSRPFAERLPRRYALIPVFGSEPLSRDAIRRLHEDACAARSPGAPPAPATADILDRYFDVLARRVWNDAGPIANTQSDQAARPSSQSWPHRDGLADYLCAAGYDTIWTQWPTLEPYDDQLPQRCANAGMRIIHTVHNVLPHERSVDDVRLYGQVYRTADALIVHSRQAADEVAELFPGTARRIVEMRHGINTLYPRVPGARERVRARLGLDATSVMALVFGGVRPYKNIDALLGALRDTRMRDVTLVVAGWEWGYATGAAGDRLARTRSLASRLGVADRVRLLPGPFGVPQTSALFEAADLVPLVYLSSSGSGVLCLGMTFQRHIVCTRVGGMAEYFGEYPACTIIDSPDEASVADGLYRAAGAVRAHRGPPPPADPSLHWDVIVGKLLPQLETMAPTLAFTT